MNTAVTKKANASRSVITARQLQKTRMQPGRFLVLVFFLMLRFPHPVLAQSPEDTGRDILVLHAYHEGYAWTNDTHRSLLASLALAPEDELHIEYLDLLRNPSPSYQALLAGSITRKLETYTPSLVIVSDDHAFEFLQNHLSQLRDANIVFYGLNQYVPEQHRGFANVTGVNEALSMRETIEIALTLRPHAKRLAVVNGVAASEQRNLEIFHPFEEIVPPNVQLMYLNGLEPDALSRELSVLTPEDIVLSNQFMFNETELARFGVEMTSLPLNTLLTERVDERGGEWRQAMQNTYFSYELFTEHDLYMWIVDPETGIILDANDSAVMDYGYPNLVGMHIWDINMLKTEEVRDKMKNVQTDIQNRFQFQHRLADGTIIDAQIDSYPITVANKTVLFSIIHDITDKLQTERALALRNRTILGIVGSALIIQFVTIGFLIITTRRRRASEREALRQKALVERITDNAYDIMSIVDAQGNLTFQSNVMTTIFDLPPSEYIGRSVFERLHPDDKGHINALFQEITEGPEKRTTAEFRMQHRNGTWIWLEASALNLLHDDLIKGILVSSRNITERKEEQAQLIAAKEEAEQALQTQKRFLANMSHEIRTPMNGFLGMVQLLGQTRLDSEQQELLELADKASKALVAVLNDILEMSRIDAGKVTIQEAPYRPLEVMTAARDMFLLAASYKGLELRISAMKASLPEICLGDAYRISQILDNLVGNAVKFSAQGLILLSLTATPGTGGHTVRLAYSVTDSGIGIAEDQLERIFDPFSQADDSMTKPHGGSGLGLAICRSLARLMAGDVTVESELSKGSRFTFTYNAKISD